MDQNHQEKGDPLRAHITDEFGNSKHWKYLPLFLLSHCMVFIVTSLIWGGIILLGLHQVNLTRSVIHPDHPEPHGDFISNAHISLCGNSPSEAKASDCEYDILSNHWIPSPCMDHAAVEEYQTDGSWFGFADENRTALLSIDDMSQMEFYYTSERDHIVHCAMLWRKQFRAFFEGRTQLDTIIASERHTTHCSQFLIDMTAKGPDYWNMPIKTWVGYGGCWSKNEAA
ncbi:MAG: hypothetical protein Q9157_007406 [Trypethelium eluteriae]